jgi:hypothetical protein
MIVQDPKLILNFLMIVQWIYRQTILYLILVIHVNLEGNIGYFKDAALGDM